MPMWQLQMTVAPACASGSDMAAVCGSFSTTTSPGATRDTSAPGRGQGGQPGPASSVPRSRARRHRPAGPADGYEKRLVTRKNSPEPRSTTHRTSIPAPFQKGSSVRSSCATPPPKAVEFTIQTVRPASSSPACCWATRTRSSHHRPHQRAAEILKVPGLQRDRGKGFLRSGHGTRIQKRSCSDSARRGRAAGPGRRGGAGRADDAAHTPGLYRDAAQLQKPRPPRKLPRCFLPLSTSANRDHRGV